MIRKRPLVRAGVSAMLAAACIVVGAGGLTTAQADADTTPTARVIARSGLEARDAPTTNAGTFAGGPVPYGQLTFHTCKVTGTNIDGNNRWYQSREGFLSARYLENVNEPPPWCGGDRTYTGRAITAVSARQAPNTADRLRGYIIAGDPVPIICKISSQTIHGNDLWYWTADHSWVSARHVENVGAAPQYC